MADKMVGGCKDVIKRIRFTIVRMSRGDVGSTCLGTFEMHLVAICHRDSDLKQPRSHCVTSTPQNPDRSDVYRGASRLSDMGVPVQGDTHRSVIGNGVESGTGDGLVDSPGNKMAVTSGGQGYVTSELQ